jgi:hypothetical protein
MIKRLTILFSVLLIAQLLFAQTDSSFQLVRTYEGDIASAAMDNLDNLYIISSKGQVKKFNQAGDSSGVYNQVRNFGKISSLDVSNPLKILLFYKDFSTIVVLDRFLTNISTIDLRKFSILQPGAIGVSYDNNIWVFDEYDNKLKKIDEQGNRLFESSDFRSVFNQPVSPQRIMNEDGLVYLADTLNGVFVFDNYGAFQKKIPVMSWQSIAINRSNIISTSSEWISVFNTVTLLETKKKPAFFTPYLHSFTTANKLITFSNNKLQIWQIRL